jgi:hypothetical protein
VFGRRDVLGGGSDHVLELPGEVVDELGQLRACVRVTQPAQGLLDSLVFVGSTNGGGAFGLLGGGGLGEEALHAGNALLDSRPDLFETARFEERFDAHSDFKLSRHLPLPKIPGQFVVHHRDAFPTVGVTTVVTLVVESFEPSLQLMVDGPHPLGRHVVLLEVLLPVEDRLGMLDRLVEIAGRLFYACTT